ncbi:MAG TPA: DUF3137 domain-containing protein [Phycisphaerales bacterium]|nr:DUF3137 domain-containing protein [Phycisphaerales bacterium]
MEVLLTIVVIVVGIVAAVLAWQADQRRRKLLIDWAAKNGWTFSEDRVGVPDMDYDLFRVGHTRWSRYWAEREFEGATPGLERARVRLFEYHYAVTRSNGKQTYTQHYYFTCGAAEPGVDLGRVFIRDENWGDKLVQAVGFDDIDLEDADFSKRFVVKARDRKEAYDLLDGAMMRFLTTRGGWVIETNGRELFVYRSGRVNPGAFEDAAGLMLGFVAQLPRVMVNAERARLGLPALIEAGSAATASREARTKETGY